MPAIRYTQYSIREYETYISAEKEKARKDARISQAFSYYERAGVIETAAQKRTCASLGVNVLFDATEKQFNSRGFYPRGKSGISPRTRCPVHTIFWDIAWSKNHGNKGRVRCFQKDSRSRRG